jgi:hypothetical protein
MLTALDFFLNADHAKIVALDKSKNKSCKICQYLYLEMNLYFIIQTLNVTLFAKSDIQSAI